MLEIFAILMFWFFTNFFVFGLIEGDVTTHITKMTPGECFLVGLLAIPMLTGYGLGFAIRMLVRGILK